MVCRFAVAGSDFERTIATKIEWCGSGSRALKKERLLLCRVRVFYQSSWPYWPSTKFTYTTVTWRLEYLLACFHALLQYGLVDVSVSAFSVPRRALLDAASPE